MPSILFLPPELLILILLNLDDFRDLLRCRQASIFYILVCELVCQGNELIGPHRCARRFTTS